MKVRWKIFLFLFAFGFIAYLQARTLSVAGLPIMQDLGITEVQLGWMQMAFLLGYTALQFPGGLLGQRLGARVTFTLIGLVAVGATLGVPLAPLLFGGTTLVAALFSTQFLLGAAQGPIFPVSAGVFESWFKPAQWPLVQGIQSMGLGLGAALTPPLISQLMERYGWQHALTWTSLPTLLLIAAWAWYGRNTPAEHRSVSAAELAELPATAAADPGPSLSWRRVGSLLADRDVLVLTLSYFAMNFTFYLLANWCFIYLVKHRHFGVLEGGWLATAPPLAAAIGAGAGGVLASLLLRRMGARRGLRLLPLLSLPLAGLLLLCAAWVGNAYLALAALALSFASVEINEGPYWAAIMHVGRGDTMAASGVFNTGGNLGGVVVSPILGYLAFRQQWTAILVMGATFAFISAALWLLVDPERHAGA